MDVVFYYPKFPSGKQKYVVGGGSNRMTPPLDMGWIAKLLEKEGTINFEIVDANINRYSFDEVKKILSKLQPKIILTTSEPYEANDVVIAPAITPFPVPISELVMEFVTLLPSVCSS